MTAPPAENVYASRPRPARAVRLRRVVRRLFLLAIVPLPSAFKVWVYRRLGWRIGRGVRIGLSYLDTREATIGDGVHIGHLNVFKNLGTLEIGDGTYIKHLNEFAGGGFKGWANRLTIGRRVKWMSRHYVDASGGVEIGDESAFGGRGTQFWTHGQNCQVPGRPVVSAPVSIGRRNYVGAGVLFVGGRTPDDATIGAGAVVARDFSGETCPTLIVGNPAEVRRRYELAPTVEEPPEEVAA